MKQEFNMIYYETGPVENNITSEICRECRLIFILEFYLKAPVSALTGDAKLKFVVIFCGTSRTYGPSFLF